MDIVRITPLVPIAREIQAYRMSRAMGMLTASAASVIVTGVIAALVIVAVIVLAALGRPIPGELWGLLLGISAYYFGTSTRAAVGIAAQGRQTSEDQAAEQAAASRARNETGV